jgi:bis(5'-nucleosidyl)-tetraphosphatase
MKKSVYRRGVFLVVYRKNKDKIEYLLLKRKLHWKGWEFPKGGLDKGEAMEKGVKRECYEETGQKALKIKKYRKSGKYKYNKKLEDRQGFIGQTYSLYSIQVGAGKVKIDKSEHSGHKWVGFDQAIKMLKWPNQRACLRMAHRA